MGGRLDYLDLQLILLQRISSLLRLQWGEVSVIILIIIFFTTPIHIIMVSSSPFYSIHAHSHLLPIYSPLFCITFSLTFLSIFPFQLITPLLRLFTPMLILPPSSFFSYISHNIYVSYLFYSSHFLCFTNPHVLTYVDHESSM